MKGKVKNFLRRITPKKVRILRKKLNFVLSYNFPDVKRKLLESKFPGIVQIQTTSLCNSACTICPYPYVKDKISHGKMDEKLYRKIIDECSKNNVFRIIPYLMNEPLIDKRLVGRIKYARKKNPDAYISISTNASLLDKKTARGLLGSGLNEIGISFQGIDKKSYERIMRGLSYEKTIKNIACLTSLPRPKNFEVIINQVVKNADYKRIQNFWKGKNVDTVYVGTYISRAGFLGVKKKLRRLRGCFDDDRPLKQISILWNGDVILCCMDWKREIVLGNVKKQSLEEIWNSVRYKVIRDMIYSGKVSGDNFICKRCEMAWQPPPLDKMITFRRN